MEGIEKQSKPLIGRIFVISLMALVLILSVIIAILTVNRATIEAGPAQVNVLANSTNQCVDCHRNATPGIVEQYGVSSMARANVKCESCHEVEAGYPGSVEHEGTHVLQSPSTEMCNDCHSAEVAQFNQSRHGIPAYVAYNGTTGLTEDQMALFMAIPEGQYAPDKARNQLFELEGEAITEFACKTCHNIGKPHEDGSVGQCQKCHMRHEFSLEQARKPETCNACHIGPDHPQWEIYQESPHGIAYATSGDTWNWDAEPGTLTVKDFPAPTCQICHMSGFGGSSTSHDVGDRLTWFLFSSISERRPAWQDNKVRMQSVCQECHNQKFIDDLYTKADAATESVNDFVKDSNVILNDLQSAGLLTAEPFDEPFDFAHFNLWHHWGRTAKFGSWMQGPDYVQWHGAYEILHEMSELKWIAKEKMEGAK
ncbi:MAG: nitrate reductase [Chloroflexi bacterium HGW-Chloroflexi-10]|nr:MAG: nitrate reductase [Chloroflexi bacterium HGW-Chloroflexi-10]